MKLITILIAAIAIVAVAFFIFDEADGPAESAGAVVDEAVNDASRAVKDVAD